MWWFILCIVVLEMFAIPKVIGDIKYYTKTRDIQITSWTLVAQIVLLVTGIGLLIKNF